jgi:hypothetical protein
MAKDKPAAEPVATPAVELDLETASNRAFNEAMEKFYSWSETQPEIEPLEIENGWYEVTWVEAQDYLRRNVCNREPTLNHVKKLHYDMVRGNWRRTGQGLVFNDEGKLNEGQQRLLACYFGKVPFKTFIVTDAPSDEPDLFAFYDDVRPRSAADALQTSGSNGIATHLSAAVRISDRYDREALGIISQPKIHKLTNREVLSYSREHPSLSETAHLIFGTYNRAVSVIKERGVAIVFADRVIQLYGAQVLDTFLVSLGNGANLAEDDPILGLRNRLMAGGDDKLGKERTFALLIKGFNLHRAGKKLSRNGLFVRDNEKFPKLESGESAAE